jgi:hypothetical protein
MVISCSVMSFHLFIHYYKCSQAESAMNKYRITMSQSHTSQLTRQTKLKQISNCVCKYCNFTRHSVKPHCAIVFCASFVASDITPFRISLLDHICIELRYDPILLLLHYKTAMSLGWTLFRLWNWILDKCFQLQKFQNCRNISNWNGW